MIVEQFLKFNTRVAVFCATFFGRTIIMNNNYLYELEVKWWSLLDLVNSVDLGSDIHG